MANRFIKLSSACVAAFSLFIGASSCSDTKSYAELLNEEAKSINSFLVGQNVILDIPADNDFITGENAPYYRIDEEGNIFMQIIDMGDTDVMAQSDQQIYFRFTRYNLNNYNPAIGLVADSWGNADNLNTGTFCFRYGNYTLKSSSQWGSGLQSPLQYVGMNSHVRLVIRSQYGLTSEISYVMPYLYDVRYMLSGTSGLEPGDDNID